MNPQLQLEMPALHVLTIEQMGKKDHKDVKGWNSSNSALHLTED